VASKPQKVMDARGRPLIERRGLRQSRLLDTYHLMRSATWTEILLLFAGLFVLVNLLFATVYYLTDSSVLNSTGFLDDLWFSVQTLATIGYGYLAPAHHLANAIMTVESFVGMLFTALLTGVFFARFSTPSARVVFSRVALIAPYENKRVLMFRMANERTTAIVEATVRAYYVGDETLGHGETMRRVHDLTLRRSTSPVFALSFLVVHEINDASPLGGKSPEDLRAASANIVITFTGIDDRLAQTVHSRYVYTFDDIEFDRRYADLFKNDPETGQRYLDMVPFHDTEALREPAA
jgi:inward rectifier potassium channel